jgi:hypothetical protein
MKTLFDPDTHAEVLERLGRLTPDAERHWGKMSPTQMMEHAARALEMASGKRPMKWHIIGKALSWYFKKEFVGEKPFNKNRPTGPDFIIKDQPDFEPTRLRLSEMITEFHGLGESAVDGNIHGFFGPLTGKQWGETQYKHVDHHFRQFGV